MNVGGYALGLLYLAKMVTRRRTGFQPVRWGGRQPTFIRYGLGTITILLLAWCLTSAINARAVVDLEKLVLVEKPRWIEWLPHSYDQPSTWFAFWQYLGLAGVFWALRDWVSIASPREQVLLARPDLSQDRPGPSNSPDHDYSSPSRNSLIPAVPDRLNRFLWVLCVNGAAVALVGIISTFDNPSKVLWLLPHETRSGNFFGPFWYRIHGAAFANLIWPVCLGLWLAHSVRSERTGFGFIASLGRSRTTLVPMCTIVMVASPFLSSSRGGSVVAVLLLAACLLGLLLTLRTARIVFAAAQAIIVIGGGVGLGLAWEPLHQRFFRDFYAYPTLATHPLREFTIRAVLQIPSGMDRWGSTYAGLYGQRQLSRNVPGTMMLSLLKSGVFEARFVGADRSQVLTLTATNALLSETGRTVELIFTQRLGECALYVEAERVNLHRSLSTAGFEWADPPSATYLWVGRSVGGSMKFNDHIEVVTLLDRALTPEEIHSLSNHHRKLHSVEWAPALGRSSEDLGPRVLVEVRPYKLSPTQWLLEGMGGRREFYEQSRRMMSGHPPFLGSGPGTFASLFKVHLQDPFWTDAWAVHDDFLETRLTFGLVCAALIYAGLALCPAAAATVGGIPAPWCIGLAVVLALSGSLLHARFDWIFQIHSLLFSGVVLVGLLGSITLRHPQPSVDP